MRRLLLVWLLLTVALAMAGPARAQSGSPALETLSLDFWPDYDRAAVLVLVTGTLAEPGTVTLPFPAEAEFHVLARIDDQNTMIDDLSPPTYGDGTMTFTTPDRRFRVEYYLPYAAEGGQRTFTHTWLAGIPVDRLLMTVQQPAAATALTTEPPAIGQAQNEDDGLLYHNLPAQSVPAGQPASLEVRYTMAADTLTAASSPQPAAPPPAAVAGGSAGSLPTWALVVIGAGAVLLAAGLFWQLAGRQPAGRTRKPRPRRATANQRSTGRPRADRADRTPRPAADPGPARFCHQCGEAAQPGDQFCRYCGTPLKRGQG